MGFIKFIFSKVFLINFAVALTIGTLGLFGIATYLNSYTYHDETIEVPDFSNVYEDEAERLAESFQLRYMVIDSVYTIDKNKGKVLDQEPKPGEKVKRNRIIYLTLNAKNPPKINMPNLVDLSFRQAASIIEVYGLKVGDLEYVPDIAYNAVLAQKDVKGRDLEPGSKIAKGSKINLVLGLGESDEKITIPLLIGKKLDDAKTELNTLLLNIGSIVYDKNITDSTALVIYRQIPSYNPNSLINIGKSIDVFVTQDVDKIQDAVEMIGKYSLETEIETDEE
jgi:eukaryotic-like serine/threonine-protein kinase